MFLCVYSKLLEQYQTSTLRAGNLMSPNFITTNRDQQYLFPPSIQDWLPEDHLARFVVDIVSQLNIRPLSEVYGGRGSKAYHPAILLSLLFYGYATGVYSSRKIEQATYDSVAFRFISVNTHPDHDTIATFRKRFLDQLQPLFVQILVLAREMGVMKLGKVSLDGTKVKANASKHHALSWGHACKLEKQLQAEVQELMRLAEKADSEQTGKKPRGPKPKSPESGPRKKDQVNLTDEESRIMPTSGKGFEQAYNAQATVDVDTMIIVESHVSQSPNDKKEITPTLLALKSLPESLGKVDSILADTGYFSDANVSSCKQAKIEPFIPPGREKHNQSLTERFATQEPLPEDADSISKMRYKLKTDEGRRLYAKRKSTVEPVFGIIKHVMGFRKFLLRGFESVTGEWTLVSMAWNLKRMFALKV